MERSVSVPRVPATSQILDLRLYRVSLACGDIGYVEEGQGPTILLLHAAPLTSLGFLRVIRGLRGRYRVIAPDFPGFGTSLPSADFGGTLADHARFLREFCEKLELDRFYVYLNDSSACLGFSGLSAMASKVRGLVVASTVPLPLTGRAWLVKLVLEYVVGSRLLRLLNRWLNLLPWLVATVAPVLRPFSRTERAALLAAFDAPEKRDRVVGLLASMGADDAFMQRSAQCARDAFSRTPALLLYGQFDPMRLAGAVSRFRKLFADCAVCIIPLEEHFPILAAGDRVAAAVHAWISSLASDAR